ncbi:MAG: aldehyde:ferredoxin oxidoreductase [Clostridia bacterium]|nr:aldehyde:ferredoxin oxidoreductase [Clostridia bacterium]
MAYLAGPVENKFSGSGGGLLGSVVDRKKYGTPFTLNITNAIGILPTRNFLYGQYDLAGEIDAEAFRRKVVVADKACYACSMACTKFSRARTGPYKGAEVGGPEYETNALFGANIDNPSLEAIVCKPKVAAGDYPPLVGN